MQFVLTDLMRSVHIVAASVWIGGSVVYMLVIIPALRLSKADGQLSRQIAALFRRLVQICMGALLLSGVYLIVDRLSGASASVAYIVVLTIKIIVSLTMMALALVQAQEARRRLAHRGRLYYVLPRWILALGLVALVLGVTLTGLYEAGIVP
jgi:putative copper export protein